MTENQKSKGKMQKLIYCFLFLFVICNLSFVTSQTIAADSTQSASPSADIKSKLKTLQEEIASRAAGMKSEVTKKLQNKAYIGTVKSKNNLNIILLSRNNEKNINVNEYTEYVIKSKTYKGDAGLKNISLDTPIACLGDIDDKGVLTAKRVVQLASEVPLSQTIAHGIITQISNGKAKLQTIQNDQFSITFDKDTKYQIGKTDGSFDDIRLNKWLIIKGESTSSATPSANLETIQADYVYIFPNAITAKPKITTPSASSVKKAI